MPDWTYRTIFRPLLFRLPLASAQHIALGFMGRLGRLPGGRTVIALMGHMSPDPRLACDLPDGSRLSSRVGLGAGLTNDINATAALSQFGFGIIEVGPVALQPRGARVTRDDAAEDLSYDRQPTISLAQAQQQLADIQSGPLPLVRLAGEATGDAEVIVQTLAPYASGFVAPRHWPDSVLQTIAKLAPVWSLITTNDKTDLMRTSVSTSPSSDQPMAFAGWMIGSDDRDDWTMGRSAFDDALAATRDLRSIVGDDAFIIQSLGVHCPDDALASLAAGADLVMIQSGLMFSGPGLPKRINEAVLHHQLHHQLRAPPHAPDVTQPISPASPLPERVDLKPARQSGVAQMAWFWALLMGAAMFGGGLLAMAIASTRVVLPYDEAMSGLDRAQLDAINPRLLAFMTHDRVTLAGTMLTVGFVYMLFAWHAIRNGIHWAWMATIVSAMAGFFSFFSFLGFGYFDPFHAFVTALLFQLLLLVMHSDLPLRNERQPPELFNSRRWQRAQWGQLLFVVHGAILIVAGLVITKVGMTNVFVAEDLEFMDTTLDCFTPYPSLTPLIAHDRATFGGMLISCGVVVFLSGLWGFRRGQAWLWWALMLGGNAAYWSTLAVHWAVGYNSLFHLLPAYGGLVMLWVGGILCWQHLVAANPELESRWRRWLETDIAR